MSELVNAVLERTVAEADHEALQRTEAEADMANVMQWIARHQPIVRRTSDAITLDLRLV
jgi:hypothetical protein